MEYGSASFLVFKWLPHETCANDMLKKSAEDNSKTSISSSAFMNNRSINMPESIDNYIM